jgi:hypothetical protein
VIRDCFSTRMYIFENIYDTKILTDLLNTIKEDTHHLAYLAAEPNGGPEYKTNYYFKDSYWSLFEPVLMELNLHLKKESVNYQVTSSPWYSEYGEHDGHAPHIHDQKQIDIMEVDNALKYSCIISLSNVGSISFQNPNHTSWSEQIMHEQSTYGKVILFPSNLLHWVEPHRFSGRTRSSFAMNGLLHIEYKGGMHANI